MRRRKVQAGGIGKALEIYRLFVTRQRVERVHHSLDDLNRGLAIGFGHDSSALRDLCDAAILHAETAAHNRGGA
jgi:hypothetical protein